MYIYNLNNMIQFFVWFQIKYFHYFKKKQSDEPPVSIEIKKRISSVADNSFEKEKFSSILEPELILEEKNKHMLIVQDEYLAKLMQNEEFLNELRTNQDFIQTLHNGLENYI